MDINKLSNDELKVIVGILTQVQLVYKDSIVVNQIIKKLDDKIVKTPPPTPQDHPEPGTLHRKGGNL